MFNRWTWREPDIRALTPRATRDYLEAMDEFNEERARAIEEAQNEARDS